MAKGRAAAGTRARTGKSNKAARPPGAVEERIEQRVTHLVVTTTLLVLLCHLASLCAMGKKTSGAVNQSGHSFPFRGEKGGEDNDEKATGDSLHADQLPAPPPEGSQRSYTRSALGYL